MFAGEAESTRDAGEFWLLHVLDDFAAVIELAQFTLRSLGSPFRCFLNIGSGCMCSFTFGVR